MHDTHISALVWAPGPDQDCLYQNNKTGYLWLQSCQCQNGCSPTMRRAFPFLVFVAKVSPFQIYPFVQVTNPTPSNAVMAQVCMPCWLTRGLP